MPSDLLNPISEKPKAGKWTILATISFGTIMATLDSSIVNIALPTIRRQLNAGDAVQWIVTGYLIALTGTLLILGRLSDSFGRKRIYIGGFALFTLASMLCGLARSIEALVLFRVLQGLGGSMMLSVTPAIVSETFGPAERGKALGISGSVVALGSTLGPVIGGILLGRFGWPSIFFVNVPLGLVAIWRAWIVIPESIKIKGAKFDIIGAGLFLTAIIPLLAGLHYGPDPAYGWGHTRVLSSLIFGFAALTAFIFWERRTPEAMLNPKIFVRGPFLSAVIAAFVVFVCFGSHSLVMPFFLQEILHYKPEHAGFIILASTVMLSIMSPVGGNLGDKFGAKIVSSVGLLFSAAGFFSLSFMNETWHAFDVMWRISLISFGFGLFQSPNSSAALNSAPVQYKGVASSMVAFMRNLGLICGVAMGAAIWYSLRGNVMFPLGMTAEKEEIYRQLYGMRAVYQTLTVLLLLNAIWSALRKSSDKNYK
ncbi:MAG: MFS transporter [Bacteroidota bacterium]